MDDRKVIIAHDGMILTNGTTYGKRIFLADGESPYVYYEITVEEYRRIMEEQLPKEDI